MSDVVRVNVDGRRRFAIGAAVTTVHVGVLVWLGLSVVPTLPVVTSEALDVVLMRPAPRAALEAPRPDEGGGAPAAPSRVHRTTEPRLEEVELNAPSAPASVQPLVLGLSTFVTASPSTGQGGAGDGTGTGSGSGAGDGGGRNAVLIQGPATAIITQDVQSLTLVQAGHSHVIMRCRVRLNQRLEGCRVIGEHPRPSGYRTTALFRSREFRFRPAEQGGHPVDGRPIVVAIAFPPPSEPEPTAAPVDAN